VLADVVLVAAGVPVDDPWRLVDGNDGRHRPRAGTRGKTEDEHGTHEAGDESTERDSHVLSLAPSAVEPL